MSLHGLRIGYDPCDPSLIEPGDRRRFCSYANARHIEFELADPRRDYDVVVVSARGDIAAWSRYRRGRAKIVYDLVDSYLVLPRSVKSAGRGVTKFLARETSRPMLSYRRGIENMCRHADAVVCSTDEQRRDIEPLCSNVHVILDQQSHLVRRVKDSYDTGHVFNFVWEGLPYTLDAFSEIRDVIESVSRDRPCALHLVTDLDFRRYAGRFRRVSTKAVARGLCDRVYLYEWNEELLATIATACDLALVPLDLSDPFARGKPENKLLLFWRMGVPAVVSATPAYEGAMASCDLDMACRTQEDWKRTLSHYMGDEDARAEAGRRGRAFTEQVHGEDQLLARWDLVFESLVS